MKLRIVAVITLTKNGEMGSYTFTEGIPEMMWQFRQPEVGKKYL